MNAERLHSYLPIFAALLVTTVFAFAWRTVHPISPPSHAETSIHGRYVIVDS